jgi:phospholipid/cholesterol/gamma-HCH transport system permease protein
VNVTILLYNIKTVVCRIFFALNQIVSRIALLGRTFLSTLVIIGHASLLIRDSIHLLIAGRKVNQVVRMKLITSEIITTGVKAIPVVALMSATIGIMLSIQGIHTLSIFGAETQVVFGLGISVPREFAPLITGILVAGRSGSQLTSRIGSMQLNGEVDALTVMGVAPARYIVAPALIGLLLSLPVLVIIGNIAAFSAAGFYINATLGIGSDAYWADILSIVTVADFMHGITKSIIFAILLAMISVSLGMRVDGGAEVLGRSTTSSVVTCIAAIIAADTIFALLL